MSFSSIIVSSNFVVGDLVAPRPLSDIPELRKLFLHDSLSGFNHAPVTQIPLLASRHYRLRQVQQLLVSTSPRLCIARRPNRNSRRTDGPGRQQARPRSCPARMSQPQERTFLELTAHLSTGRALGCTRGISMSETCPLCRMAPSRTEKLA